MGKSFDSSDNTQPGIIEDIIIPDEPKITKDELVNAGIKLDKKLILIDSSLYTKDAFEYLLKMIDYWGAVGFISNTNRIWTQGQYFGGDIFSDTFKYWESIATLDENDKIANQIFINRNKSIFKIKSTDNITVDIKSDKYNDSVLTVGYDIDNSIDKTVFTIDTKSYYHLGINNNGQIKMIKYTPISLTASGLTIQEYDSGDKHVTINLFISGTDLITELNITASDENCIIDDYNIYSTKITAIVKENIETTFTIKYSDGQTTGTYKITQEWGYGIWYGSWIKNESLEIEGAIENMIFNLLPNKYIVKNFTTKQLTITQNNDTTGWLACPSKFKLIFTDVATNLQGGWEKYMKLKHYSNNTEYQIWNTENSGLGTVKWGISQ